MIENYKVSDGTAYGIFGTKKNSEIWKHRVRPEKVLKSQYFLIGSFAYAEKSFDLLELPADKHSGIGWVFPP